MTSPGVQGIADAGLAVSSAKDTNDWSRSDTTSTAASLLTTSGHFHTRTLQCAISEIGSDRVMFSVDYPYETMHEAARWFDASLLCRNDRVRIGRTNAARVFGLEETPSSATPEPGQRVPTGR